jgi:hypothetical protein
MLHVGGKLNTWRPSLDTRLEQNLTEHAIDEKRR